MSGKGESKTPKISDCLGLNPQQKQTLRAHLSKGSLQGAFSKEQADEFFRVVEETFPAVQEAILADRDENHDNKWLTYHLKEERRLLEMLARCVKDLSDVVEEGRGQYFLHRVSRLNLVQDALKILREESQVGDDEKRKGGRHAETWFHHPVKLVLSEYPGAKSLSRENTELIGTVALLYKFLGVHKSDESIFADLKKVKQSPSASG